MVIIFAISQVFCYIPCPKSSYEAAPKQTSRYLKRVTEEIHILKPNTTTDKFKSDFHIDSASASRYDIKQEDNYDYAKLRTDLIVEMMGHPVILYSKLQPCIT